MCMLAAWKFTKKIIGKKNWVHDFWTVLLIFSNILS